MLQKLRILRGGLILVVLALSLHVAPVFAQVGRDADQPVKILPPDSPHFGKTYGEWAARWWQWAFSMPVHDSKNPAEVIHPLYDLTGKYCGLGQTGPVWFLAGVANESGVAVRTCKVPEGKALFFPILNLEADNFWPKIDPPLSVSGLRSLAKGYMDNVKNMAVTIDGVNIKGFESNQSPYRTFSPAFSVKLPNDNLPQYWGNNIPAGTYEPIVDDGYYLMVAPLKEGTHTIHFQGTTPDFNNFTLNITYHLIVGD